MKILNFGSCNIDYVYKLPHIVVPGETLTATGMELFPGGKGLNQSVAAARAGGEVYHAGVIGKDGGMLKAVLEESGADVRYLQTADCQNGHAIIQLSASAQNSIFLHVGTNGMVSKEFVDRVLADFSPGDILVLQNEISNVPYLIDRGFELGLRILFNPAPFDDTLPQLPLHKVAYLLLNEVEARGFFGREEPEAILADGFDPWQGGLPVCRRGTGDPLPGLSGGCGGYHSRRRYLCRLFCGWFGRGPFYGIQFAPCKCGFCLGGFSYGCGTLYSAAAAGGGST